MAADMDISEMELKQWEGEKEEGDSWDDDDYKGVLPPVQQLPALTPSQERCKQEILESLVNPEIATIFVDGYRGMGKRTIMQHVVNRLLELCLFDINILICLRNDAVEELQEKIAKRLSLNVEAEESIHSLATKIRSCLEGKKYCLCLHLAIGERDENFRGSVTELLEEAGIPQPNQQNGCKCVTLAYIYGRDVGQTVAINGLSEEEAWELFREKAGEVVDSPNIQLLAQRVAHNFLQDSPMVINVAGAIMKDVKDESLWMELSEGIDPFRFWYARIASYEEQLCCSYCCLFEGEHEIDINELIGYWIMDGLFGFEHSKEEGGMMYEKGLGVLKRLLDSCILQRITDNSVRMHSRVWIHLYHINNRFEVSLYPRHLKWEVVEHLSSWNIKRFLDMSPICLVLSTLLLWGTPESKTLSDLFFEHMPSLRILHLYQIVSLPPSISNLHDLRALILRKCKILQMDLDLRLLKKLEVLDVSGTLIQSLPETISSLYNLRKLLVKNCRLLKSMPDLATLEKLEVLDVSGTSIESLPDSLSIFYNLRKLFAKNCHLLMVLPDLQKLRKLEVLEVSIMRIEEIPCWIFKLTHLRHLNLYQCGFDSSIGPFPKRFAATIHVSDTSFFCNFSKYAQSLPTCFQRFYFCVSPCVDQVGYDENHFRSEQFIYNRIYDIYLKAKYFPTSASRDRWLEIRGSCSSWDSISGTLNLADLLSLKDNISLLSLSELGFENMKELRECWIERCHGMEIIASEEVVKDEKIFENLENLFISNLSNLTSICLGSFLPGSFSCLKHVYLDCCPKLENVFSSALVVEKLETLAIKYCDKLEMIFQEEVEVECVFPCLKSLLLWELPELKSICRGALDTPILEKLTVNECPKLNKLSLGSHNASSQSEITGGKVEEQLVGVEQVVGRRPRKTIAQHFKYGIHYLKKRVFTSDTST